MEKMVGFQQAKKLVQERVETLPAELVDMHKSLGRALSEDAPALLSLPLSRVSLRDGYVLNSEESGPGKRFKVSGKILAGNPLTEPLAPGAAFWISSQAVIPEGADAVIEDEKVTKYGDTIELNDFVDTGVNVRALGEDFSEGELLLKKGSILSEREVAMLLAAGHFELNVIRRPRTWVIAIGDELRHPGSVVRAGQEYPSAAWLLAMLSEEAGAELARVVIAEDAWEAVLEAMPLPESADLVITVGGTGAGRKDIIEELIKHLGAEMVFQGVKMRPSHSFAFSLNQKQVIFSLPGRINAAEIGFEFLARPAILKMQGKPLEHPALIPVRALKELPGAGDQAHIMRGVLTRKDGEIWVEPFKRKSWHKELAEADGLVIIEENRSVVKIGEWVDFMVYRNRLSRMVANKYL